MTDDRAISDYLAALPAARRNKIGGFIDLIRTVAPHAVGSIKFNMPTFEHAGRMIAVANRKAYVCVYVASDPVLAEQLKIASPGASGGKACVNYPDRVPIPDAAARETIKEVLTKRS